MLYPPSFVRSAKESCILKELPPIVCPGAILIDSPNLTFWGSPVGMLLLLPQLIWVAPIIVRVSSSPSLFPKVDPAPDLTSASSLSWALLSRLRFFY